MVMVLIYIMLLITLVMAWFGKREASMYLFLASYFFGLGLFFHHMTDVIGLSL